MRSHRSASHRSRVAISRVAISRVAILDYCTLTLSSIVRDTLDKRCHVQLKPKVKSSEDLACEWVKIVTDRGGLNE
jgi:hypothetical protein